MLSAGRLNTQLLIEQDLAGQDEDQDWEAIPHGTVWGEVLAVGGGERVRGTQIEAGVNTLVTIRFRDDVTSRMRFAIVGTERKLNIVRAVDPDMSREKLVCQCSELA